MKKLKLTGQINVVFSVVILVSTLLFGFLISGRLTEVYVEENYTRLNDFIRFNETSWTTNPLDVSISGDTNITFVMGLRMGGNYQYVSSEHMSRLLNEDEVDQLVNLYHANVDALYGSANASLPFRDEIEFNGETIYYVGQQLEGNFMIAINDNAYIQSLQNRTILQMTLIFLLILFIGNSLIALWSRRVVKRIRLIQRDVLGLFNDQYAKPLRKYGFDEIGELASSIELMRQTIEENESIKQEMLQNVGHDFKTPIAVIKSYAEAMIDGIEDASAAEVIIKQANILKDKVRQLLELSKLEYLQGRSDFVLVNIEKVIKNVVSNYKHRTDVSINIKTTPVFFLGFEDHYGTVIDNILDNAIRYAKNVIDIRLESNRLRIYNDGPRIDDQFINHLFKPYEKNMKGQFGLGMSIVYRTLHHFNMSITVKNEENGVSFIIEPKEKES